MSARWDLLAAFVAGLMAAVVLISYAPRLIGLEPINPPSSFSVQ